MRGAREDACSVSGSRVASITAIARGRSLLPIYACFVTDDTAYYQDDQLMVLLLVVGSPWLFL